MRVTEHRMVQLATQRVTAARERSNKAQTALATGVRVDNPSMDPAAWADAQRTRARTIANDARGRAIARSRERLDDVDVALGALGDALASARELAIQGSSDFVSAGDRLLMADQVLAAREEVLRVSNVRGPDAEFLLAGTAGDAAPFDPVGAYQGNGVSRAIELTEGQRADVSITGERLTAVGGVDVLGALDSLVTALQTDDTPGISDALGLLTDATDQTAHARVSVGVHMTSLHRADVAREDLDTRLAEITHNAIGADPIDAAVEFTTGLSALESARAVAARLVELLG